MKKKCNKWLLVVLLFCTSKLVFSQDIHFTQFYASPLTLNPALTGYFEGSWRVSAIYRNQWRSIAKQPFTTLGLGFDKPFFFKGHYLSAGIIFVNDQSGVVNLSSNRIYLCGSYLKKIENNDVVFGVQPGIVLEGTNVNSYTFDSQYDIGNPDIFNNSFSNSETGFNNSLSFFDLNVGVLWSNQLTKAVKPEAGISLFHLTRPSRSLKKSKSDTTRFDIRKVFHAGVTIKISKRVRLKPQGLYMYQKKATDMLFGTNVEFDLLDPKFKTIYCGTLLRNGWKSKVDKSYNLDASSWIVGLIWNNFNVGFSYDINISTLKEATNNRGAWEVSLIYIPPSNKPDKIKIPCDRY